MGTWTSFNLLPYKFPTRGQRRAERHGHESPGNGLLPPPVAARHVELEGLYEASILNPRAKFASMGGAYVDFAENKEGSLEPGKFADLIVWHDSPYTVEPLDILNLIIDLTMAGGKVVHQV